MILKQQIQIQFKFKTLAKSYINIFNPSSFQQTLKSTLAKS